jgi:hypothetical protein
MQCLPVLADHGLQPAPGASADPCPAADPSPRDLAAGLDLLAPGASGTESAGPLLRARMAYVTEVLRLCGSDPEVGAGWGPSAGGGASWGAPGGDVERPGFHAPLFPQSSCPLVPVSSPLGARRDVGRVEHV